MELIGNIEVARGYTSPAQQARLISEDWISRNAYCLNCNSDRLSQTRANTRTCDFICIHCRHKYELKSKRGAFTRSVVDGSYDTMLATIRSRRTPTFLLLEYTTAWSITGLRAIHHTLVTETAIQARKPLAITAKRAGWIGCNILLTAVAMQGQIPLVVGGVAYAKEGPRAAFSRLESFSELSSNSRNWMSIVLRLIERIPSGRFALSDLYNHEGELQVLFPNNRNIRPKIRQQLQFLRDANMLKFCGGGIYEKAI
ncbi:MAG: restriction endonuclease [Acidobacteriota bacterium]|nr:restriction endonuclease [Acidobacteriota bacterium]